jgi:hypothetical protein
MAAAFTPLTQSNPGAAVSVSESNPFSAAFWANQAALNFSTERMLAEDQRGVRDANTSYEYNRGVNERAEPLKLTANRNSANTQGLAESGVLAKTQGLTQTDYAQKNQRLAETRRNAIEKFQEGERDTVTKYGLETANKAAAANAEYAKELEENPPPPIGAATANKGPGVGAQRTVSSEPGAGGVVGYTETGTKNGNPFMVRVGNSTLPPKASAPAAPGVSNLPQVVGIKAQRATAVKKVKGVG